MRKIDLSIIIVNYNTVKLLKTLLESIRRSRIDNFKIEVFVVDNASSDSSVTVMKKEYPEVKLIINRTNLGYAKANNRGIRQVQGAYVLLLNSDTLLEKETLFKMINFMNDCKEFSVATCTVKLPDGKVDPSCHRGFPTPWAAFTYFSGLENFFPQSRLFGQYHQTWKDLNTMHEIDVISGAFFMIRKSVLDKVGLLDERFFVYAEDVDFCYRIRTLGQKIAYFPETKVTHFKKSSGRARGKGNKITRKEQLTRKMAKQYFFQTMKLFYDKHYKDKYPWIVRWLVLLVILIMSKIKE